MKSFNYQRFCFIWPFLILLSCSTEKKDNTNSADTEKPTVEARILRIPAIALADKWATVIEKDSILIVGPEGSDPKVSHIRLEFISDSSGTIQNVDLKATKSQSFQLDAAMSLEVYRLPNDSSTFNTLRITAFKGNDSFEKREVWTKSISYDRINKLGRIACQNQEVSSKYQLDKWVLQRHLNQGVFLAAQKGYSLLLFDRTAWVIYTGPVNNEINQMLHFIKAGEPFDNYSFRLHSSDYGSCVSGVLNDSLRITRIQLERSYSEYDKIRVGQFTSEGNLWVQTLIVERILDNELLKYEGEYQ